ncbi:2-dehydropantoate 2-reductase [Neobacillus notoginsengisoli]|uniref:2-dehydropantoate 2-reductase n=1 Tax=Neobacillus notoginsengisoli TaxID=1578198 RepID=A0A417YRW5_9BACI|nr:2-dehydropantoate 2-reductase [Neobacillus notoginsengisoli]RHW38030.1 2-dehydropantoate 2-reductase [Neobacillus notoginsengisoli]
MKFTIIGAGAIGGVLGAYLIKAGYKVTFFDIDEEHVKEMNHGGLTIEGPDEIFTVRCNALTPNQLESANPELETVFLCVKAQHTEKALEPFLPFIKKETNVVSIQNGLCEKMIVPLIGREKTIGCFVNFSADYLAPGKILYGGVASLYIGELDGTISRRVKELQKALLSWGPAEITENIWGYLWGKMSYAGLLYATALVDETMATVVRQLEFRETLIELCAEILEVCNKEGVFPLGFDDWEPSLIYPREKQNEKELAAQLEKLATRMAENKKTKSGIWRDLAIRKRKTEIDAQLVPILRIGANHGLEMPLTSLLVNLIKQIETGSLQMGWENLTRLKQMYESGEKYVKS